MDLISTQIYTLIATTGTVGSTLTLAGTTPTIGIYLIAGTIVVGLLPLLFIIVRSFYPEYKELKLEDIEEEI